MAKPKSIYVCQSCEFENPQWLGQCPKCGEWNTFVETIVQTSSSGIGGTRGKKSQNSSLVRKPIFLSKVKATEIKRQTSGSKEFDRVLGGGFVPGQVTLLAGEPGIGKSTLLTQIAKNIDGEFNVSSGKDKGKVKDKEKNKKVLYVCGEESVNQVKIRAERMKYKGDNLMVISETDTEVIASTIDFESENLGLIIVDSIQSLSTNDYMGFPGSVGQVRGGTQRLTQVAKQTGVPLILVGHVTKEGNVAGPKVLEHIVDTVLYLEGDSQHMFRILKTTKNRFGAVSEVGIFEMRDIGMIEVDNPSELFLSEKDKKAAGSCVSVVMEGFRPILFEIQALTTKTSFGYPVRTASGFNINRLKVLIAILEKRAEMDLSNHDVYVNIAGGFKVSEYATDLAVCLAIASSYKNKPIPSKTAAFGEVGLGGEIRKVTHQDKRVKEAKNLGYTDIVSPHNTRSVNEVVKKVLS